MHFGAILLLTRPENSSMAPKCGIIASAAPPDAMAVMSGGRWGMQRDGPVGVVLVGRAADPGADPVAAVLDGAGLRLLARAPDPADAAAVAARAQPDVVVVDLAGSGSVAAITALTAEVPRFPVLALGAAPDHGDALAAVRAGAAGYLVTGTGPTELVAAVRRMAAGEPVFSQGLAAELLDERGRVTAGGGVALTDRETEVLRLVVEGLTARQIATRLVLSPRTVENHVQHLLRKLRLPNRAALVRWAIENGLM
jgi:DNA-binding NarL/FixJ family response regulator